MKSFWRIFAWIIGVYILFHIFIGLLGAAISFALPILVIYLVYRQIVKNNRSKTKASPKKSKKEAGLFVYRYDLWKLLPTVLFLLPIIFFALHHENGWLIYLVDLLLAAAAAYFASTAFKRWASLEITDFCLARVDHRYFFRHKIIYEWPRIYYTEVQTEGLNYQLYVATLDGSFTIKQREVKNIAIPELKKLIDRYIASGGKAAMDAGQETQSQDQSDSVKNDPLDKTANYVLDKGNAILDKAKDKIDAYFKGARVDSSALSDNLSPVMIFKKQPQGTHQQYASFTAYGLELLHQDEQAALGSSDRLIPWQNISDIKVDDLKAPSKLELKLKLAGQRMSNLLIGDSSSSEIYTSSLSVRNLYTRIQSFKAHSKHTSMTV